MKIRKDEVTMSRSPHDAGLEITKLLNTLEATRSSLTYIHMDTVT